MDGQRTRGSVVFGTILLAVGVLTLAGQLIGPGGGGLLWPIIVIGFGLAFFAGMVLGGRSMAYLAIPGAIITGVGLMLLLNNTFRLWEIQFYGWALIVSAVGIGLVVTGTWGQQRDLVRSGWKVAKTGLVLFIVFGILSEMVFNTGGMSGRLGNLFWPLVLVLVGIAQLILRSYRLIRGETTWHEEVNLFWPVMFIGAGLMWALVRLGALQLSQLALLINLWPLLLIAAGIDIILGRRMQWINLIMGVLVVMGMFFIVYNGPGMGLTARLPWMMVAGVSTENQPVNQWVSGSGPLTSEARSLKNFSQINMMLSGDVDIVQGSPAGIVVEAEENLMSNIQTDVQGSQLVIRTRPGTGITSSRGLRFTVTVPNLDAVTLSGAGTITNQSLTGNELNLRVNGFGTINFNDLNVKNFNIQMNGMGTINTAGEVDSLNVQINGAGAINLPDLKAQTARITVSGLGNATVWVISQLDARVNGAGTISYYGDPSTSQTSHGIGSLRKLGPK
jgi:hypothetical protein